MSIDRFLKAQEGDYGVALREIRAGRKQTHWIWYIFPQLKGLGRSSTSEYYGIRDLDEAREYLAEPVLRMRLLEISEALLTLPSNDAEDVMGFPDNLKLHSSMTLFALAEPSSTVFQRVLDKFFAGEMDEKTVELCGKNQM
ncbi:MAG: DUF1810 domain-containing protein [Selenomonas sp.]|uniref:DUF1810 domain-containing protein n=1 Tax=Selenomonas sp. TaxID=2053611 RepID=UPI0025F42E1E|nr:DUF1810 domain-containing protein [Selenomonas sp.]MCI6231551.1 DUF1810 domain-containing protein [Selenomonas sp.]